MSLCASLGEKLPRAIGTLKKPLTRLAGNISELNETYLIWYGNSEQSTLYDRTARLHRVAKVGPKWKRDKKHTWEMYLKLICSHITPWVICKYIPWRVI